MLDRDIDTLRAELFMAMVTRRGELARLSTEDAQLLGEHAARIARAATDGMAYFDRHGVVRDPHRRQPDEQVERWRAEGRLGD